MKTLFIVVILFIHSLGFAQHKSWDPAISLNSEEKAFLRSHPIIKVSNEMDWAPFDFVQNGQPAGYSIDLMNLVADRLRIRFVYVNGMTWSELLAAFKAKKIDLMSAINYSDSRTSFAQFTAPYFGNAIGLFSRKGLDINALSDLEGKTVAVPKDYAVLEEIRKEVRTVRHYQARDMITAIQAVATGKADYTLESTAMIQHLINKYGIPNVHLSFFPKFKEYDKKYIGLRAATHVDNPMLGQVVQKALDSITFEEKEQLRRKWLGDLVQREMSEIPFTQQEQAWLQKHPVIKVSNEMDYPPFDFVQNGQPTGYNIDLLNLLAKKIGIRIEYVNGYTWNEMIEMFKRRELDLMHALKITPDRQKYGLFSVPYRRLKTYYVTLKDTEDIQEIKQLYGKRFVVGKGWFQEEYLKKHHPQIELLRVESMLEMLEAVADGKADVTAGNRDVLEYFIKKHGLNDLKVTQWAHEMDKGQAYTHNFMVQKDAPELVSILNKTLESLTVEDLDMLNRKWFGMPHHQRPADALIDLTPEEQAYLQQKGMLKKCALTNYVPMEWINADGKHDGIASTFSQLIAERTGVPIRLYQTKSWQDSLEAGKQRRCDMFTVMMETPSHRKWLNFTTNFFSTPLVLATKADTPFFHDVYELKDKKIGVVQISSFNEALSQKYPDFTFVRVQDIKDGLEMVRSGELYGLADALTSLGYRIQKDHMLDLKIAGKLDIAVDMKMGVRNDEPMLLGILQKAVDSISEEEKREIVNRWILVKYEQRTNYTLLWQILVVTFVVVGGIIYWNRHLSHLNQKISQAEERFRSIVEASTDWIWEVDAQGYYTFVSAHVKDTLGYDPEELIGKTPFDLMPKDEAERIKDLFSDFVARKVPFKYLINLNFHKDGHRVVLETSGNPILNKAGKLLGYRGVDRDITKQIEFQSKLEKAKIEAESANQAKSEFLSNMSHELRTPLNAILGFSQIIAHSKNLSPEDIENLQIVNRSGEHLLSMINDVLDLTKIEAGQITLNVTDFDLYNLLDDLKGIFKLQFENKMLFLRFEIAPEVPQYVRTDGTRLRQVLVNLLSNAVKFTNEGGVTVRVKCNTNSDESTDMVFLQFEVEDTGSGISSEHIDQIFDPFVQDRTVIESHKGTGLGLSISRKFVQLMNGDLTVESQVGDGIRPPGIRPSEEQSSDSRTPDGHNPDGHNPDGRTPDGRTPGSLFKAVIPVERVEKLDIMIRSPLQKIIGLKHDQSKNSTAKIRILLVDDDSTNRELLLKMLSPIGFEIKEARNGKEAIEVWNNWHVESSSGVPDPPDLIWMDILMPVMDGYEATKEIKRMAQLKGYNTIIIAISASAFDQDVDLMLSSGCDDFISKPFKESEIFEKMQKHLGLSYVYEDAVGSVHHSGGPSIRSSSFQDWRTTHEATELQQNGNILESIQDLPSQWKIDMKQAIEQVNVIQMKSLVAEIYEEHTTLANAIQKIIDQFEYQKILKFINFD